MNPQGPPTLAELRRLAPRLRSIAMSHGCRELRVFGSVARGGAWPASDLDLLVNFPASPCPASTPLADWRQSSWPVSAVDRPHVVVGDNMGLVAVEATRELSHPSVRAIDSTGIF